MSNDRYYDMWIESQNGLINNYKFEDLIKKKGPYKNLNEAARQIGRLYINYVLIINKLNECYDQICHPQKVEIIGKLLDLTIGRILEIKQDLVKLHLDDYNYLDNALIEMKLTHADMEIKVPPYYWRERQKKIEHRKELIAQTIEEMKQEEIKQEILKGVEEEDREEVWEKYLEEKRKEEAQILLEEEKMKKRPGYVEPVKIEVSIPGVMPLREAALIIQRHERARQGRHLLSAAFATMRKRELMKTLGKKELKKLESESAEPENYYEKAALVIQRYWRKYWKKVLNTRRKAEELELLGIVQPSWTDRSHLNKINEVLTLRRKKQEANHEEYTKAQVLCMNKIEKLYTPVMAEDIGDELRFWYKSFLDKAGDLPPYPDNTPIIPTGEMYGLPKGFKLEAQGGDTKGKKDVSKKTIHSQDVGVALSSEPAIEGSALIVAGHWIDADTYLDCKTQLEKEKSKKGSEKKKEKPPKLSKEEKLELKQKEKALAAKRLAEEEAKGFTLKESHFATPVQKLLKDYRTTWDSTEDDKNQEEMYNYQLVHNEKCYEGHMNVRKVIDDMMREELEIMKMAVMKDRKKKYKKPKSKKPKKKKKGKKDPTENRSSDDLFCELYRNGIIREYEEAHLPDFMGEKSFSAFEQRLQFKDPLPGLGDVSELLLQYCIMPLGSSRVHQLAPLVRSVCLLGAEGNGKELLARIICTEAAAILFDLTPSNIMGKYPGKKGLKMLQHLVEKMSRMLQPSVILINGAEKPFARKVQKADKGTDPKRLKKLIPNIVKGIKAEDQVLVLGISSFPWLCSANKLIKTYDRFVFVPQPQYGTYYRVWEQILTRYHSLNRELDFSALAKASEGYSIKNIIDIVEKVLDAKRICKSAQKSYTAMELIEELCKLPASKGKEQQKCLKFLQKTPLGKKKTQKMKEFEELKKKEKK